MKRFITGGVVFLLAMFVPAAMSPWQTSQAATRDYRNDSRLESIRRFFHQGSCPAEALAPVFLQTSDAYNLDWRLLPSISFVESTGGKAARNNNMFGWNSGRTRFKSFAHGIQTVGYKLSHMVEYRGKALEGILAAYNPDPQYARLVKMVMRSISPHE